MAEDPHYTFGLMRSSPLFRAWLGRFFIALVIVSVMSAGGISGAYWYADRTLGQAEQAEVKLSDEGPTANFLIVGSDTRDFVETKQEAKSFGSESKVGGQRADTIMIVRVDPKTKKALLASIPRDTRVQVQGLGSSKINAAYLTGPQRLIDTIQSNFDVPIHHYVEVNFKSFKNIVDALGGVRMYVPSPVRDFKTGLNLKTPGCQTLNGDQALAWARSREYQHYESGRWKTDPTADIGRITRQQTFIASLMNQAIRRSARDPRKITKLASVATNNLKMDTELDLGDLNKLSKAFRSADPAAVEMTQVPTRPSTKLRGAQDVTEDAEQVFARLRGEEPLTPTAERVLASDVRVRVLNGTGALSQAGDALAGFDAAGFAIQDAGDNTEYGVKVTQVRYPKGSEAKARLVLSHLRGAGKLVQDSALKEKSVVVVTGEDFRGVADRPGGEAPTATTTTVPATSTPKPNAAAQPAC